MLPVPHVGRGRCQGVSRRFALPVLALLSLVLLAVPGQAATSSTLTVTSAGTGSALLYLPAGTRLGWSGAAVSTRGSYAAVVLDRLVPDRAQGTTTAALAQGQGLPTGRQAPSDSAAYPSGLYGVYVVSDGAVTFHVTVTGMTSAHVKAQNPLGATARRVGTSPTTAPAPTSVQAPVGSGPQLQIGLVRWDLQRPLGPYQASIDLCSTSSSGDCQGTSTSEQGLSLGLNQPTSLSSTLIGVRTERTANRLVSHLSGDEQPSHVQLLALGVPLSASPAPATTGALQIAAAVYGAHGDDVLLVGRLGSRLRTVYTGVGEGAAGIQDPSVSPDGTQVAFIESDSTGSHVAVVFADGSAHRWLTPTDSGSCMSYAKPVWAPDGARLYIGGYAQCQAGAARVWTVIADGAHSPTPLHLPAGAVPTAISRDGSHLLVTLPPKLGQRWMRTGLVRTDGTELRTFGGQGTMGTALSPSGHTMAAAKILAEGDDKVRIQVQLFDTSSARATALSVTQSNRTWGSARPLAWSPDGKYVYYQWYGYQRDGRVGPPHLYRITTAGSGRTDLTPAIGAWNTALALQPRLS